MPKMHMDIPHQLGEQEALTRIQTMIPKMKERYGQQIKDVREEWTGSTGVFAFNAIKGMISVHADEVVLNGDLPIAASPFKGRIESMIRERAAELLAT
jgi:hypothetical protein